MSSAGGSWTSLFEACLDYIFPSKCPLCGLFALPAPCSACADEFVRLEPTLDPRPDDAALDYRAAVFRYEGRAAQAVRRLKYNRATALGEFMAATLRREANALGLGADFVVPVPIHWSRRAGRGFNQAELLASQFKVESAALTRIRRTRPQVGLSRVERARNLAGAFRAAPLVQGRSVLLIDDVLTSGQTAHECATALRAAGAAEVGILAFCGEL